MKRECRTYCIDGPHGSDVHDIINYVFIESPILWLGGGMQCFSDESIKLIVFRVLCNLPYYQRHPTELQGLNIGRETGSVIMKSPLTIIFCDSNVGAEVVAREIMEESIGEVSIADAESVQSGISSSHEGVRKAFLL